MVSSGLVSIGKAGEVLQVRDRSGRDWCGRIGKASSGQDRFYAAGVVGSGTLSYVSQRHVELSLG